MGAVALSTSTSASSLLAAFSGNTSTNLRRCRVLLSAVLLSAANSATHLLSRLSNISLVRSGRPTSWGARELNTGPATAPNCLQQRMCYLPRLWCAEWRVTHWELNLAALCSSLSSCSRTRAKLAAASLAATVSASLYTWTNQRGVLWSGDQSEGSIVVR